MKSRDAMPKTAEWIDSVRAAFGKEFTDDILRRGIRGEPVFHAWENGFVLGTPLEHGVVAVKFDERGVGYVESLDGDNDAGSA